MPILNLNCLKNAIFVPFSPNFLQIIESTFGNVYFRGKTGHTTALGTEIKSKNPVWVVLNRTTLQDHT